METTTKNKITKRIRIKKDHFLKGYFSIHATKYVNGEMVYDSVLNYFSKKKDAITFKQDYKNGKAVKFAYPSQSYAEFIQG